MVPPLALPSEDLCGTALSRTRTSSQKVSNRVQTHVIFPQFDSITSDIFWVVIYSVNSGVLRVIMEQLGLERETCASSLKLELST